MDVVVEEVTAWAAALGFYTSLVRLKRSVCRNKGTS
jgi:hypothetical protein